MRDNEVGAKALKMFFFALHWGTSRKELNHPLIRSTMRGDIQNVVNIFASKMVGPFPI